MTEDEMVGWHHCLHGHEFECSLAGYLWLRLSHKATQKTPCVCCCSVAQSCPTLCDPWTAARQASLSITNSRSSPKLMSTESVMPSNHLSLCHPLLLLPSLFPSIRVQ